MDSGVAVCKEQLRAKHQEQHGVPLKSSSLASYQMRTLRAHGLIEPVGYQAEPEEAVRRLTARLSEALSRLIVEAGDRQTMRLVQVAESIWRAESPALTRDPAASASWRQRVVRAHRYLADREPARVAALRQEVERYAKALELAGLTAASAGERPSLDVALRYALREGTALLLGLPLALLGIASHAIPYNLTRWAIRFARPSGDAEATYKIAGGMFIYLFCWAAEGWTAWRLGGPRVLTVFVASLLPTGFFALDWAARLARAGREARRFVRLVVDRDLPRLLLERRRAIMEELRALLRLVPEPVLDGSAREPIEERQ